MVQDNLSKLTLIFYALLLCAAIPALAQKPVGVSHSTFPRPRATSDYAPSVGLKFGAADTEGIDNGTTTYGIEIGIQPYIPFTAALEYSGYATSPEADQPSMTRSNLLAKGIYNFSGDIPLIRHSYIGVGVGSVWDHVDNQTYTNFGVSPELGFDFPLTDLESRYSLGANANYLFVGGARDDLLALNAMVSIGTRRPSFFEGAMDGAVMMVRWMGGGLPNLV